MADGPQITRFEEESRFKRLDWVSTSILQNPLIGRNGTKKGAIVLGMADEVLSVYPELRDLFYVIEWRGWSGMNSAANADIKLVEDESTIEDTRRIFPNAICLDLGSGDFVNTKKFLPNNNVKTYSVIQIASWSEFKRHELLLEAARLLPEERFYKFGHFPSEENLESMTLKRRIIKISPQNIEYLLPSSDTNERLPKSPEEVAVEINKSRMGILTSRKEGMNRFKMECLSCNIPFLVPADSNYPVKKHINELTGMIYEPTPDGLSKAIVFIKENIRTFKPREYVIRSSGMINSNIALVDALNTLAIRDGFQPYFSNLNWDGRNQSLKWGRKALRTIREVLKYG